MKNLTPGSLVWYKNQIRIVVYCSGQYVHLLRLDFSTEKVPVDDCAACLNVEIITGKNSPGTVLRHRTDGLFVVQKLNPIVARCIASENLAVIGVLVIIREIGTPPLPNFPIGGQRFAPTNNELDDIEELSQYADYNIDQFAVVHPADLLK